MRKELGFEPGQILDYKALKRKEKQLSGLDPEFRFTITVLDSAGDKAYKDILVQVEKNPPPQPVGGAEAIIPKGARPAVPVSGVPVPLVPPQPKENQTLKPTAPDKSKNEAKVTEKTAKELEDSIYESLKTGRLLLKEANCELFVRDLKGRRLIGLAFIRRNNPGYGEVFMMAEEAEIKVDLPKKTLQITTHKVRLFGWAGNATVVEERTFPFPLPSAIEAAP